MSGLFIRQSIRPRSNLQVLDVVHKSDTGQKMKTTYKVSVYVHVCLTHVYL